MFESLKARSLAQRIFIFTIIVLIMVVIFYYAWISNAPAPKPPTPPSPDLPLDKHKLNWKCNYVFPTGDPLTQTWNQTTYLTSRDPKDAKPVCLGKGGAFCVPFGTYNACSISYQKMIDQSDNDVLKCPLGSDRYSSQICNQTRTDI
jgi:hypothetical protein